jgi:signal transduction histidine kinase
MINIYKHAQATEVMVSLRFLHGMVTIVVQDNGRGTAAAVSKAMASEDSHFGLRTLQAQVAGLNGVFDIYDADERGLALRAIIPVAMPDARHGDLLPRASEASGRRESA